MQVCQEAFQFEWGKRSAKGNKIRKAKKKRGFDVQGRWHVRERLLVVRYRRMVENNYNYAERFSAAQQEFNDKLSQRTVNA